MHDSIPENLTQSAFDFDALAHQPVPEVVQNVSHELPQEKMPTPKFPNTPGIYRISFSTAKFYIGSAVNLRKRCLYHLQDFRAGRHKNPIMQNLYNKHSEASFTFEVLEHVDDKDMLIAREQWYIDTMLPPLNICPTAGSSLGRKFTDEHKRKISASTIGKKKNSPDSLARRGNKYQAKATEAARIANIGRKKSSASIAKREATKRANREAGEYAPFKHTDESKAKMSASHRGLKHTDEAKEKNRLAHLGKKKSPEEIARRNATRSAKHAADPTYGKAVGHVVSDEQKARQSAAMTGRKKSPESIAKREATKRAKRLAQQQANQPPLF